MPLRIPPAVVKTLTTRSRRSIVIGFVMLFGLFLSTAWIGALCLMEKQKHGTLRETVASIRRYMVSVDENYDLLNDTDLILEVEKLARPLTVLQIKVQELEDAIEDLQGKLATDWILYRGKLYYFGDQMLQHDQWVKLCATLKSEIVSIQDREEQAFLETSIASRFGHFWIGYQYHVWDSKFVWHNPEVPASPTYWVDGFPQYPKDNQCVLMTSKCPNPYKCWMNYPCHKFNKGICKKSPELKWLS